MKKTIKATLLSAFVFPGIGHLLLKRYISAALLATTTLTTSYLLISQTLENAMLIVDKIQRGEVAADMATITQLASQQTASDSLFSGNILSTILLLTWVIAIIDSYRVGRSQEHKR